MEGRKQFNGIMAGPLKMDFECEMCRKVVCMDF